MEEKLNKAIEVANAILLSRTRQLDMQQAAQAVLNLTQAKARYTAIQNGIKKPTEFLNTELEFLLGRVRSNLGALELQQVTQAAMHLMSAKETCEVLAEAAKPTKETKPKAT